MLNRSTLLVFKSMPMSAPGRALDKVFVAKTTDGGRTWRFLSWIVPTWDPYRAVMPSTVRGANEGALLCAIRRRSDETSGSANWMDLYQSKDHGETWSFLTKIADCGGFDFVNGLPNRFIARLNGGIARPVLLPPVRLGGGELRMMALTKEPAMDFILETSTNLLDWQPLGLPGTASNGLLIFDTPDTHRGQRFYRGLLRP